MSENLWVKRVTGSRPAGHDEHGFPLEEPIYGEPEQCLPDSLIYAFRNGYVQCEAPVLVPVLIHRPELPEKSREVAEDGWPVDAPRFNRNKKKRF